MKKSKYKGSLARPIKIKPPKPISFLSTEEEREALEKKQKADTYNSSFRNASEAIIKFGELFKHYKIDSNDPDRWFSLSLALAMEHVPGFRLEIEGKKGRKEEWDMVKLLILYKDVEYKRWELKLKNATYTDSAICEILIKKQWKDKVKSAKVLKNRYIEAKSSALVKFRASLIKKTSMPLSEIEMLFNTIVLKYNHKPSQK